MCLCKTQFVEVQKDQKAVKSGKNSAAVAKDDRSKLGFKNIKF